MYMKYCYVLLYSFILYIYTVVFNVNEERSHEPFTCTCIRYLYIYRLIMRLKMASQYRSACTTCIPEIFWESKICPLKNVQIGLWESISDVISYLWYVFGLKKNLHT